jgi:acyl-CoA thioesterase I
MMSYSDCVDTASHRHPTLDKAKPPRVKQYAVVLLVALFLWAGGTAQAAEVKTILAFGDSITAGYGLPRENAPPQQLQALLQSKGVNVEIMNAGVSGDTTAGGVTRLAWTIKQKKPDYAILALGGNDMLRGMDPATTEQNLRKMMQTFKENNIPVLLAGMRAPVSMGPAYAGAYLRMYKEIAKDFDAVLYPFLLEGIAMNPQYNLADGVHPNAAGASLVAARMMPYVVELLKK